MVGTRNEIFFMARLAEQAERYEDMVHYMGQVAVMGVELTSEERNLLSVAYKNSVGSRRLAWRAIAGMEIQQQSAPDWNAHVAARVSQYKAEVEKELDDTCQSILDILDNHLIGQVTGEVKVFYMKMKGDYHRYKAEFKTGDSRDRCADEAKRAYESALQEAKVVLSLAHPIRLGLALNFSVFYNEVLHDAAHALELARETTTSAQDDLDNLDPDSQRDAAAILQLLYDNLSLWQAGCHLGEDDKPAEDGTAVEEL